MATVNKAGRQAIHKGVSASGGRQWRGEDDRAVSIPDARVGNQFFYVVYSQLLVQ